MRQSLRRLVMLGAVLWTIGLLTCVTILFTFSARARDSMIIVHSQTHTSMVVAIAAMLAGLFLVLFVLFLILAIAGVRKVF